MSFIPIIKVSLENQGLKYTLTLESVDRLGDSKNLHSHIYILFHQIMKNYNWKQYYSDFSKQWIIHFLYKLDRTFTLKFLLTMEATTRTSNTDTNVL